MANRHGTYTDIRGCPRILHTATVMEEDVETAEKFKILLSEVFSLVDSHDSCIAFAMCRPSSGRGPFGHGGYNDNFCKLLPSGVGKAIRKKEDKTEKNKNTKADEQQQQEAEASDELTLIEYADEDNEWEVMIGAGGKPVEWYLNDVTLGPIFINAQHPGGF
jgi:hypothetical protein